VMTIFGRHTRLIQHTAPRCVMASCLLALCAFSVFGADTKDPNYKNPKAAPSSKDERAVNETRSSQRGSTRNITSAVYAVDPFAGDANGIPASEMSRPRRVSETRADSKAVVVTLPAENASGPTPPPQGISTAPMSVGEKFNLFAKKSFFSPGAYALSAFTGIYGEWLDDDNHHHSKPGDFAADSGTRAARSFAFRATANFFEKFAYPSMFKQDPRYHRSGKKGAARIGYAISRIFVTQGDRGGTQFNASFIGGGLTAAAISNAWERDERVTALDSLSRWGFHVGITAFTNILREFIGGQ